MRVNLFTLYAGPRGSWGPGLCDIPADIGKELIEAGVAILVNVETRDVSSMDENTSPEEAPVRRTSSRRTSSRRNQMVKPEE